MITEKTIFILGAGASKPFGMPLGHELIEIIKGTNITNDKYKEILDAIKTAFNRIEESDPHADYSKRLGQMQDLLSRWPTKETFDFFLLNNRQFNKTGKAFIAFTFYFLSNKNSIFNSYNVQNWYNTLWGYLHSEDFENFLEQPLKIYTFNYDFTLDYFLLNSIDAKYNMGYLDMRLLEEKCKTIMPIHIYGSMGKVSELHNMKKFEIGQHDHNRDDYSHYFNDATNQIHLINERATTNIFNEINNYVLEGYRVVFLGFGFDEQNLKNLRLDEWRANNCNVIGTAFGLSNHEFTKISKLFSNDPSKQVLYNQDCNTFLRDSLFLS